MSQKQIMMIGIDTDLSVAAEEYLKAVDVLNQSEDYVAGRRKDLIKIMKKIGKTNFTHNGHRFVFRSGHRTESSIVLKSA